MSERATRPADIITLDKPPEFGDSAWARAFRGEPISAEQMQAITASECDP